MKEEPPFEPSTKKEIAAHDAEIEEAQRAKQARKKILTVPDEKRLHIPEGVQATVCSSCQSPIVWLRTAKKKRMPVDAYSVTAEDFQYDHVRHVSHFATCPNATKHRR